MFVGCVIPYLKSYTNTPTLDSKWVECNGQTLNDPTSPYHNQVIPNLNGSGGGTKRFLRGSRTSGTTGGADTNTHTHTATGTSTTYRLDSTASTATLLDTSVFPDYFLLFDNTINTIPSYYEVVYIMKIK